MVIENIMYFALGLLVAGLVSLIILPAVWKRAVRLTKRRIEAATPITMAEFRADKDQLRAEFALSTRRLEVHVDTLRKRLAEQLGEVNQARSDLGMLKAEREKNASIIGGLEAREAELRTRLAELEREGTDLAQRLRMRDRELETRSEELEKLREVLAGRTDDNLADAESLVIAEASIASAESRLNALFAETSPVVDTADQSLADRLSLDDDVETLREKVLDIESTILSEWDSEQLDEAALREKLNDIAADVSRLVYAADTEAPAPAAEPESLFDRVQRFAADDETSDALPIDPPARDRRGSVSDRMTALREIQSR